MRLIDADNALELFRAEYQNTKNLIKQGEKHLDSLAEGYTEAAHIIKHISPTVDAVPVVHSRWAHIGGDEWCCPVCGFIITTEGSWDKPTKKYCEDCGAKMDGGTDNAEPEE
jgi:hypothetical protein